MNTYTQPQGMLSNPQAQAQETPQAAKSMGFYNGTVDVFGTPVQVVNGIANFEGEEYHISKDGSIVADSERNIIGYVVSGVFKPIDDAHMAILEHQGVVENE